MVVTSLLALKTFLNSVVADDLHVVGLEGSTLTISRSNSLDVPLGTFEFKDPEAPPAADPASELPVASSAKAETAPLAQEPKAPKR